MQLQYEITRLPYGMKGVRVCIGGWKLVMYPHVGLHMFAVNPSVHICDSLMHYFRPAVVHFNLYNFHARTKARMPNMFM